MSFTVLVTDLETASELKKRRLLTSSIRHEPTFKHDDPDEPDLKTKKGRKVASFSFEKLLPLPLTKEEANLAVKERIVVLERVSHQTFRAQLRKLDDADDSIRTLAELTEGPKDLVFQSLWMRGWWMVDGLKFGVDYLAYTKDPSRHHADFMIFICPNHQTNVVSALDLITMCTVAAKAKKKLLLASVVENQQVILTVMQRKPLAQSKALQNSGNWGRKQQTQVS